MALGRKKGGGRKEPLFGLPAALSDLRLSLEDRVGGGDDKPKKLPKRKTDEIDDDEPPPERKPRASRSGAKRRSSMAMNAFGR